MTSTPVRYTPDVETVESGEEETSRKLNETFRSIREKTSTDYGHAVRSVHAKSHALLEGELTVASGLPLQYAQGLFSRPGSYKLILRFSTIPGDILDDSISVPRGLALKIIGVEGDRLPGSEGDSTQDFIMVNSPRFAAGSAKEFLLNLKPLAASTDKAEGAKKVVSAVMRGAEAALESVGLESAMLKQMGGAANTNPLGETYYTQTAFRFGDYIAKLSVAPASTNLTARTGQKVETAGRPDALREDMAPSLARQGGEWDIRVQLCTDLKEMPVEDASKEWDEEESPFFVVGRVKVAPQTSWSEARSTAVDDGLSFSPWHGLAAHQPLGALNRVRRSAYKQSADDRAAFNGCPIHEPSGDLSLPA